MRDDAAVRRREEPTESLFPETEGPSFCLRPTPLFPPPSNELRHFGRERYTHPDTLDDVPESRVRATASIPTPAPPLVAIAIEAPGRRGRRARQLFARSVLLLMLGALLGLFGYGLGPRLASLLHELQERVANIAVTP